MKCTFKLLIRSAAALFLLLLFSTPKSLDKLLNNEYIRVKIFKSYDMEKEEKGCYDKTCVKLNSSEKNLNGNNLFVISSSNLTDKTSSSNLQNELPQEGFSERIYLAVVCCGERADETKVLLKSAVGLSKSPITLIVFTEEKLKQSFKLMYSSWPLEVKERVTLDLHSVGYPNGQEDKTWRNLFKPCASQRLFFPSILKDTDSLIYVDTDVLFVSPIENLWGHFHKMNSSQMAAVAPEHEDLATGWYNRFAKHPYYGKLGVNSGVMLMNLTRLRKFGWENDYVIPIHREYKSSIIWGDQDIINIIFHYHPDKLYIYGCEYNMRPDHCMYMSVCKSAEKVGVKVVHGNRGVFHKDKQPAFKAIYRAWDEYQLGQDIRQFLYYPMQRYLLKSRFTTCGKLHATFLGALKNLVVL